MVHAEKEYPMNVCFVIHNGKVEETDPVQYWNTLRQIAQDSVSELTGDMKLSRRLANRYLDESWQGEMRAWNHDTGELCDSTTIPAAMWNDFKRRLLDEVKRHSKR